MFHDWEDVYWRVQGFSSSKKVAAVIWEVDRAVPTAIKTGLVTSSRGLVRSSKAIKMCCAANKISSRLLRIFIFAL